MKTIGILGGMGPLATVDLFKKIIMNAAAAGDNDHIPILIDNNTRIPDRTAYLLHHGKDPLPELVKSAVRLEMMGADVLVMPCNTAHFFINELIKYVSIPFLNMLEETAKEIKAGRPALKEVGLLATEGTYRSGIYESVFHKYDLNVIIPDQAGQQDIMQLIYSVKSGTKIELDRFKEILKALRNNFSGPFVLGCTELPVAFRMYGIREDIVDPTNILARSALRFVGKKLIS
ncbi:MAG: amino acid racemase [Eubacteriales bacterium]|jgi:aspartate racemase|nr:amino acid racemase [Eubacteriales bacterium]